MTTPSYYAQITQSVLRAYAEGYYCGRVTGIEDNPYTAPTYINEHRAYADGFEQGVIDFNADA